MSSVENDDFSKSGIKEKDIDKRNVVLIAMFDQGFAAGWKMAVSEAFQESLDIRMTDRTYEDITQKVWTQGSRFAFKEGATIYDTKLAYELKWGDALKHIKVCVEVIGSEVATPKKRGRVNFNVMRPNADCSSLRVTETFVTTQDEFVCLLQTGKFHPLKQNKLSKEIIDLFTH